MIHFSHSPSKLKESNIFKHYLSNSLKSSFKANSSKTDFINRKFIQNSKDLNLRGKVISTDFGLDLNPSFQGIPKRQGPIKLNASFDVDILLNSSSRENKIKTRVPYLKSEDIKQYSAFRDFPQIKPSSVFSLSSPLGCFPAQIIEKKSYSTKEDDSMPKIKTMILTPRKTINDFSHVYSKNTLNQNEIGNVPQIIPSIPLCMAHLPVFNSQTRIKNESQQTSCFLSKKKKREHNAPTPIKKKKFMDFNSSSSFKAKKIKKSKKSIVEFENKNSSEDKDQRYNFLLEDFKDKYDSNWNYDNESSFISYQFYLTYGKSNEEKMRFGENPLNYYQNLIENIKSESSSNNVLQKIENKMTKIQSVISSMPVFKVPINKGHYSSKFFKENDKETLRTSKCCSSSAFEPKILELKFKCTVCGHGFSTAQGLGGHMSRKHKDQSENYKKKKATREKRAPIRLLNGKIKKILCEEYSLDYYALIATKHGKKELKKFIDRHHQEYVSKKKAMR